MQDRIWSHPRLIAARRFDQRGQLHSPWLRRVAGRPGFDLERAGAPLSNIGQGSNRRWLETEPLADVMRRLRW